MTGKPRASSSMAPVVVEGNGGSQGPFHGDKKVKDYLLAMLGEFVGTFLFLFMGFSAIHGAKLSNASTHSSSPSGKAPSTPPELLLYIALAFGFSLAVNVWLVYRVSGGHLNPAVTFGFVILGLASPLKGALMAFSQILGGIVATGFAEVLFPGKLEVNTTLGGGTSVLQGFFIEAFLTFQLSLTIFMLAVEKHRATAIAPVVIGLSLFIAHLVGIYFTGASLNPARSFGPALVSLDFPGYHWIYWLGPVVGSSLAAGFYKILLVTNYYTANPGQDSDGLERGRMMYGNGESPASTRENLNHSQF